jgi:hypothetical protein
MDVIDRGPPAATREPEPADGPQRGRRPTFTRQHGETIRPYVEPSIVDTAVAITLRPGHVRRPMEVG